MIWLYLAALVFGVAFTGPMLVGGLGADADADIDVGDAELGDVDVADFDLDADVGGIDADFDAGDAGFDAEADIDGGFDSDGLFDGVGDFVLSLLSFRSIVFASTFFGLAGAVLSLFDYLEPVPLASALILGFLAAVLNSSLMKWLRGSEANSQRSERNLVGSPAEIVLPLGPGERGRIKIDLDGQPRYFVARAFRDGADQVFTMGDPVVVVEIDNGTALVAPLPAHELE